MFVLETLGVKTLVSGSQKMVERVHYFYLNAMCTKSLLLTNLIFQLRLQKLRRTMMISMQAKTNKLIKIEFEFSNRQKIIIF